MFPALYVHISGLDPRAKYCVFLDFALAHHCRFKYSSSVGWSPAGNEEAQSPQRIYRHPESPSTGEQWMSQIISFGRVKLTNTCTPPQGHMVLSSMHKYQPRILIVQTSSPAGIEWAPTRTVVFPETAFIAVTAYQNDKITKLKIDHNPFAKGFRENGKSNTKKRQAPDNNNEGQIANNHQNKRSSPVELPKEEVVSNNNNSPPVVPFYGYCYPTYFYNPSYWTPHPLPFYYRQSFPTLTRQQVDRSNEDKNKPKKLTDFSIRAITGIS